MAPFQCISGSRQIRPWMQRIDGAKKIFTQSDPAEFIPSIRFVDIAFGFRGNDKLATIAAPDSSLYFLPRKPEHRVTREVSFPSANSSFCQSWSGTPEGLAARSSQRSSTNWSFSEGLSQKPNRP